MTDYHTFLTGKHVRTESYGFDVPHESIHPGLLPFAGDIVVWACRKGRAAIFADTGLTKTRQYLEWAKLVSQHTGRKVLILVPLAVAFQTVREGRAIDLEVAYVRSQVEADAAEAAVIVANYEMLAHFTPAAFVGVVLDESSVLKQYTGKTRMALTAAFADTPYRLCCTATPAPNDHLELGQHAEFLGIMPANEMIMRWFVNDTMQAGNYRLKGHAAESFWDWMASWAVCVSKPSDLGHDDTGFVLPGLTVERHLIQVDHTRAWEHGQLFLTGKVSATGMWREKRQTLAGRVAMAAHIVATQPDEPWAIWCDTNDEADALTAAIPEAIEVRGSHTVAQKEARLNAFSSGEARIIITKAEIAGMGLNWQHCANTAFVGLTFSFEKFYQALRRFYRFGQRRLVTAHLVVAETESDILSVVARKQEEHQKMQAAMTAAMRRVGLLQVTSPKLLAYDPRQPIIVPSWLRTKEAA
jgi:SNF2-related domain